MKFLSFIKLLPFLLPLVACTNNLSSKTVVEAKSPEKDFGVEIQSGIPSSSYGPHPVRVYVTKGEKKDLLIRTPLFNDGQNLKPENAEVKFEGDTVLVCLKGAVQADKLITFNSATKDYSVKDGDCGFNS